MQNNQHKLSFFLTAARLQDMLEALDDVHTSASENAVEMPNGHGKAELVALLREISYLAAETADELEQYAEQPTFRVIEGGRQREWSDGDKPEDYPLEGVERPDFKVLVGNTPTPLTIMKRAGS